MSAVTLQGTHPAPSLQKALSQKFRAEQARVGAVASATVVKLWNGNFQIREARKSWNHMRPAVVLVCQKFYAASQASAQVYYNACRMSAGLGPLPAKVKVPSLPLTADRLSKVIDPCGLGAFLHEVGTGAQMMDAWRSGRDSLGSAVANLVMSAARDWTEAAAKADPASQGIRRVTGGTCSYCEDLANEGVTVADAGWHNDCECTNEPTFGNDTGPSPSLPDSGTDAAPASEADDVTDAAEPDDNPTFYHGTNVDLQPGDLIQPADSAPGNADIGHSESRSDMAYMTRDKGLAAEYAGILDNPAPEAAGDDRYAVYQVEPTGEFEKDSQHSGNISGYDAEPNFRSKSPLRVIKRLNISHQDIAAANGPDKWDEDDPRIHQEISHPLYRPGGQQ